MKASHKNGLSAPLSGFPKTFGKPSVSFGFPRLILQGSRSESLVKNRLFICVFGCPGKPESQ